MYANIASDRQVASYGTSKLYHNTQYDIFRIVYIMQCMQRKSNLEPTNRFLVFHKIQQSHATITASC